MLMYTKYTYLHYFNYLNFCVSYTSSVNCIRFPIVNCTINKSFIDTLCLDKKLLTFKVDKSCQILCAHKHCFLMPGHIYAFSRHVYVLLYSYVFYYIESGLTSPRHRAILEGMLLACIRIYLI